MRGGRAFMAITPALLVLLATVGAMPCAWCPDGGSTHGVVEVATSAEPDAGSVTAATATVRRHGVTTSRALGHHLSVVAHPAPSPPAACATDVCLAACAGSVLRADAPAGMACPGPGAVAARTADRSPAGEPRPPLERARVPDGLLSDPVGLALACQATIRC